MARSPAGCWGAARKDSWRQILQCLTTQHVSKLWILLRCQDWVVGVPRGLGLPGQVALCSGSLPGRTRCYSGCKALFQSESFSLLQFGRNYLTVDCTADFEIYDLVTFNCCAHVCSSSCAREQPECFWLKRERRFCLPSSWKHKRYDCRARLSLKWSILIIYCSVDTRCVHFRTQTGLRKRLRRWSTSLRTQTTGKTRRRSWPHEG